MAMRKLKKYKPTKFKARTSHYDKEAADYAVNFIQCLCHTKGTWAGKPFELIDWQEQIVRDLFGIKNMRVFCSPEHDEKASTRGNFLTLFIKVCVSSMKDLWVKNCYFLQSKLAEQLLDFILEFQVLIVC